MVGIALRAAPHEAPLRHVPHEEVEPVEDLEHPDPGLTLGEEREEGLPHALGPSHLARHAGRLDRIEGLGRGHAPRSGHLDEGAQDALGARLDLRRHTAAEEPREDRAMDVLDLTGVLEDAAHERVDGGELRLVGEAEEPRDLRLLLQVEPIGGPAGLQVERAPDPQQELVGVLQGGGLGGAEQPAGAQHPEVALAPEGGGEPAEGVDVPQPAGALLQVRLEQVADVAEALRTSLGVGEEAIGEALGAEPRDERRSGPLPELGVPRERAPVEQRRGRVEAFLRDGDALLRGPHRVPEPDARVPQGVQERIRHPRHGARILPLVQEQEVHVRAGRELGSAVAAEGHQGDPRGGSGRREELAQAGVDDGGATRGRPPPVVPRGVGAVEGRALPEEAGDRRRALALHLRGRPGPALPSGSARPPRP
ncbi:MAG: hypothetical protein KatS3mg014_0210 [Actinomycetota bacterium]|nr:MAG: hypothetical protein KatS3mg014_0210 [Actinomycetota bacterium]